MALLPVAAMIDIPRAEIVSDYGIAADGHVASVSIFSQVPMEEVEAVYMDYQSRTSVRLARLLLEKHWKKEVAYKQAPENYIEYINGKTAGVIIGDRALKQLPNFEYVYDLAEGWKDLTGMPFVFAAWIANKKLPEAFVSRFNEANALGLEHIDSIVAENPFPYYDLKTYYQRDIHYFIDQEKKKGLMQFLEWIR
jgi:chorismate dehydratase